MSRDLTPCVSSVGEELRPLNSRFFSRRSPFLSQLFHVSPFQAPSTGNEGMPLHSFKQNNNTASSMHTSGHQHSVKRESAAAMTACTCTKMKMIPLESAEKEDARYSLE
jgi:hypothetical protein